MRIFKSVAVAAAMLSLSATACAADDVPVVLLQDVTIVDGLGNPPVEHQDVLLADGKISRIAPTTEIGGVADSAVVISGESLTLMPGLIDAYVLLPGVSASGAIADELQKNLNAHLYSGVTTVHDMDNDLVGITRLRDDIAAGTVVGPHISTVGRTIDHLETMKNGVFDLITPETQNEISAHLDQLQANDIQMVRLYAGLSHWVIRHFMVEAKKRGMSGTADLWCSNLSLTAFRVTKIDGFSHGGCWEMQPYVAEWMRDNEKFALLTFSTHETMGGQRPYAEIKTKAFLSDPLIVDVMGRETVEAYHASFHEMREQTYEGENSFYNALNFEDMETYLEANQANLRHLYKAGALIGMGTAASSPPVVWPGESLHRELQLHVESGVTPVDAIKMATYNNARIIGRDETIGSVEQGKAADLLIVRGEPWVDIADTRNVTYVIQGGNIIDRATLKAE